MKQIHLFVVIITIFISFHNIVLAQGWSVQVSNTTQQLKGLYVISETEVWACGDGGVVLHTIDAGANWSVDILTGADLHSIVFKDALTGIVVGDGGTIFKTTDGGANWLSVNSGTGSQLRAADWGGGDVVWSSGRDGAIVKSTDMGQSWSAQNSGTSARFRGMAAFGMNNAWAVGESGIIKATIDGGVSWVSQQNPATDDLHDVQFLTETLGFAGGSNSEIIFTNNGGQTWSSRSNGIQMGINGIYFLDENNGWAVSDLGTVYITSNGGINWGTQPSNTTQTLNEIYFLSSNLGWAVGDFGAIVRYNGAVTSAGNLEGPVSEYQLSQNYPNPFNPSTQINFAIPNTTKVSLKVFNAIGKEVATLIDGQIEPGNHSIVFDATDLSSGVYYYTISAENLIQTKKMILLR